MLLTALCHPKQEPLETWVPDQRGVGGILPLLRGFRWLKCAWHTRQGLSHRERGLQDGSDLNKDRPPPESLPGSPCDLGWDTVWQQLRLSWDWNLGLLTPTDLAGLGWALCP